MTSPILETARLRLLPPDTALAPACADYVTRNRAFLAPFEPIRPEAYYTEAHQRDWLAAEEGTFAEGSGYRFYIAEAAAPQRVIGMIALTNVVRFDFLSAFLGYKLDGGCLCRGYMTEAVAAIADFAFQSAGLHRIEANVMPRNAASLRVLEKCGFENEGLAKKYLRINGVWEDHIHMALRCEKA